MSRLLRAVFCFLLLSSIGKAQQEDIFFKHYGLDQGLSSQNLNCIFKDSRGFLWIGTRDGLNCFDGRHFKIYRHNRKDSASIINNNITCITEDKEKNLWISSWGGLSKLNPFSEKFINYIHDEAKANSYPYGVAFMVSGDDDGNIWSVSYPGICKFNKATNNFTAYNLPLDYQLPGPKPYFTYIFQDSHRRIWIGSSNGLFEFNKTTGHAKYIPHNLYNPLYIDQIIEDSYGNIWLATWGQGLVRFDPENCTFTRYLFDKFSPDASTNIVGSLCISRGTHNEEILWIGASGELIKMVLNGKTFPVDLNKLPHYQYSPTNNKGMQNRDIHKLYTDDQNIVWVGGETLDCIIPSLQYFKIKKTGPQYSAIYRVLEDTSKEGKKFYWIGSWYGGGLFKTDEDFKNIQYLKNILPLYATSKSKQVNSIIKDHLGNIWVGTLDGLVSFKDGAPGYKYYHHENNNPNSLSASSVVALMEDSRHRIWIGMYQGAVNVLNTITGKIYAINKNDRQDSVNFRTDCFYEDGEQNIWACTDNGLKKYNEHSGQFETFYYNQHNPKSINARIVYGICEDKPRHYWVATDLGLNEFDSKKNEFTLYGTSEGLCNDHVTNIVYSKGKLILGTENGLSVFDPVTKKFNNFFEGDGLESNDVSNGYDLGSNGILYIGGSGSVCLMDINSVVKKGLPTPALLTSIRIFDKEMPFDKPFDETQQIQLNYKQNYLTFAFTAPDFVNAGKTKFYCKMEGLYDDWVDNGNKQTITYTNLDGGNYTFRVKAVSADGLLSGKEASIKIYISPPFWKTPWFFAGSFILVSLSLFGLFNNRINKIRKEEQAKAKFRQEISEMEMKALRAQMNPHFVFNALNSIQDYMLHEDKMEANKYLSKFGKLMRLILENSEKKFIPISDETDALKLYLDLESLRLKGFTYNITVDPGIDVERNLIPPMIIQPFIENAIWHGLANKKEGERQLTLRLIKNNASLLCIVEDNGVGRAKVAELKEHAKIKRESKGVKITEDRLNQLSLANAFTGYKIIDLYNDKNEPTGTRVEINIPMEVI